MKTKFYSFEKATDTSADLYIYGDIVSYEWDESDVSAFGFKKELEELGDILELNVHINSLGGSTYQGLTIYNLLKQHKAKINMYIDGIAASAASIIAMAGDKVYMPRTSMMMIHNCWTWLEGNAKELRKTADDMDKLAKAYKAAYLSKINITEEKLDKLLDEESYLTADECVEMGFADEVLELDEKNLVNQYSSRLLCNLVNKLKEKPKQKEKNIELSDQSIEKIKKAIISELEEKQIKDLQSEKMQELLVTPEQQKLDIKEIIQETIKQLEEDLLKGNQKETHVGLLKNKVKEDAWASFFNTKK